MINEWDSIPENLTLDDLDQLQIIANDRPTKRVAVRIGLVCSMFVREPLNPVNRLALAQCGDHYQQLVGEHLKSHIKPDGAGNAKPYPAQGIPLVDYVREQDNIAEKSFNPYFFGDKDPYVATPYGLEIFASSDKPPLNTTPAYFKVVFPFSWLKGKVGQGAFQQLVHEWCKILKPFHGYAGIGAIQSMHIAESGRTRYLTYPLSKRFLGLEIDDPGSVASKSAKGGAPLKIKGVNWLTALDTECLEELGGHEAVLGNLEEGFQFFDYEGGVLIRAGSMPQIGDINQQHIPMYYQQLARKLKPLRMNFPDGHSLIKTYPGQLDKTNTEATNEWLARFD